MKSIVGATVVAFALMMTPTQAITVSPMTFEQLVDESVAIVYARVTEVRGQWTDNRRSIDSIINLESLSYLKGNLGVTVPMRLPGGRAGGVVNLWPGAPVLREGELVVVFLGARGPSVPFPLGLGQGIFRVSREARSRVALVSPPLLRPSVRGSVIRGAAARGALTLDALAAAVRSTEAAR